MKRWIGGSEWEEGYNGFEGLAILCIAKELKIMTQGRVSITTHSPNSALHQGS